MNKNGFIIGDSSGGSIIPMAGRNIPPPAKLNLALQSSEQAQQWEDWFEELQLYLSADNITYEKRKYSLLLYLGGSEVREIYATFEDEDKTFKSATDLLNKYFIDKKNPVFERYVFIVFSRKQTKMLSRL